jgi:hypothetical protein
MLFSIVHNSSSGVTQKLEFLSVSFGCVSGVKCCINEHQESPAFSTIFVVKCHEACDPWNASTCESDIMLFEGKRNEEFGLHFQVVARGTSLPFMKKPLSPHSSQRAPSCRSDHSS